MGKIKVLNGINRKHIELYKNENPYQNMQEAAKAVLREIIILNVAI